MGIFGGVTLIKGRVDRVEIAYVKHSGLNERCIELQIRHPILKNVFVIVPLKFAGEYLSKLGEEPMKEAKELIEKRIKAVEDQQNREMGRYRKETDKKKLASFEKNRQKREKILQQLRQQLATFQQKDIRKIVQSFVGKKLRLVMS